jgi:hypothetical protein
MDILQGRLSNGGKTKNLKWLISRFSQPIRGERVSLLPSSFSCLLSSILSSLFLRLISFSAPFNLILLHSLSSSPSLSLSCNGGLSW